MYRIIQSFEADSMSHPHIIIQQPAMMCYDPLDQTEERNVKKFVEMTHKWSFTTAIRMIGIEDDDLTCKQN